MMRLLAVVFLSMLLAASAPAFPNPGMQSSYSLLVESGIAALKSGDYPQARESFEAAVADREEGFEGHLGLGLAYYHLFEDREAERALTRASEIDGRNAVPHRFLGELSYRREDFETALAHWEKAVQLDPADGDLSARLIKLRKEHHAEKDFDREMTSHFQIKFEGRENRESGRIVLRILEEAYGEVGRALSYYPEREIQVILYSARQFQEVTDAPGWSGGVFDGKIRIPAGGIDAETAPLRRLLFHEYTHAAVRAITPRCPTWLNEGLAQHFEGRGADSGSNQMLKSLGSSGKLPSLKELEGSFLGLSEKQASLAYLASLSAVRHMIDSLGMYRVRAVLDALASGKDTATAMFEETMLGYDEFEHGWKRSLE